MEFSEQWALSIQLVVARQVLLFDCFDTLIEQVHLVGGISGLVATLYLKPRQHRFKDQRARQISDPTKAILAGCLFYTPWQATLVGAIGSTLALIAYPVLERAK
ncbi:hypothetical protein TELCIR_21634, partial [Teladorsagia circumcincta]